MNEEIGLLKLLQRSRYGRLLSLALAGLVLTACGASVQRSYGSASTVYPRYVVVTPAPLPAVAAPVAVAPRVVIAAPPLTMSTASIAAAPYTPAASPLLAAFDSHPRGMAPSQPDYDAYVQARAEQNRPYYVYRPSYGYGSYLGYGPTYGYGPYYGYGPTYGYGPRFGVALPLWGAWRARGWSNHWHGGGHHWHGPRGDRSGSFGHGYSRGSVHHAAPYSGGAHHGGGRHR